MTILFPGAPAECPIATLAVLNGIGTRLVLDTAVMTQISSGKRRCNNRIIRV